MKMETIKYATEALGMLAIVASLIFVGLQMRQTHEIALVTLYQMRADAARELLAVQMESEVLMDIEAKISAGGELSAYERQTRSYLPLMLFNHFENSHYLFQHGFLEEEHWSSDLDAMRYTFETYPRMAEDWEDLKDIFRPSFVRDVDAAFAR